MPGPVIQPGSGVADCGGRRGVAQHAAELGLHGRYSTSGATVHLLALRCEGFSPELQRRASLNGVRAPLGPA